MPPPPDPWRRWLSALRTRWAAFAESRRGALTLRVGRVLFVMGIVGYLAFRLTEIGWGEVLRSLPATPWFYLLFLVAFLQLPFIETLIYRVVWDFRYGRGLPAFFKKRVFNQDVLGYSGEVYLYLWARKHVERRREGQLWRDIRDNNILSSAASTLVGVGLLAFFVAGGYVDIRAWLGGHGALEVALVAGLVGIAAAVAFRFRRYLFATPPRLAALVFSVHVVRLLIGNAIQVAQWAVVIPEVPLATWFTFLAAVIVLDRVPFLPNRDLLFFGIGLEMGGAMGVPMAELAGMLLTASVLAKGLNLSFLGISFLWAGRGEALPLAPFAEEEQPRRA